MFWPCNFIKKTPAHIFSFKFLRVLFYRTPSYEFFCYLKANLDNIDISLYEWIIRLSTIVKTCNISCLHFRYLYSWIVPWPLLIFSALMLSLSITITINGHSWLHSVIAKKRAHKIVLIPSWLLTESNFSFQDFIYIISLSFSRVKINSMFRTQYFWWRKIIIFISFSSLRVVSFVFLLISFNSNLVR